MPQHQGNVSFQQYQAKQQQPRNSDYMQMIMGLNIREGQDPETAELNAVREMQHYMKNGINPMGPINGREAGLNEIEGSRQAHEAMQLQEQKKADTKQQFDSTVDDFNKWLMKQGKPPMPKPRQPNNRGWEGATEALQQLQNLQLPVVKY
ncbi:MAG TPA: hypothetical protein EYQ06_01710 [Flavobacteriales bacterium]|jgi:hypothetical protein|nr:hypothetical protein [Flavobacteriales bacterium]